MRFTLSLCCALLLVACGDSEDNDGGTDSGGTDSGGVDSGGVDSGGVDSGGIDAGGDDGGGTDSGGIDGGGTDAGGSGMACSSDSECTSGSEWCEGGRCVACDNSGLLCDIACSPAGWMTYMRNGCSPCDCGPPSECDEDTDCRGGGGPPGVCYAGEFCWCDARTPDCCLGNLCSPAGCTDPNPEGCSRRGCPSGQECRIGDGTCVSSSCMCSGATGSWGCSRDCGGGTCVTP